MSLQLSSCLLGLLAALPASGGSCQALNPSPGRIIDHYGVELRCLSVDGLPIPGVLIKSLYSGVQGHTDRQGRITFRIDAYEGTAASFRVEKIPPGLLPADGNLEHRVILKTIAGSGTAPLQRPGALSYDILMRRSREEYVLLVSTKGAPALPVMANGVRLGNLNRLGAGLFRVWGQPGEELKVVIQTGASRPELSQENPEQTFSLPGSSSILSFASTLAPLPPGQAKSPEKPVITFVPEKSKHRHHHRSARSHPKPEQGNGAGPIQVPFRGIVVE